MIEDAGGKAIGRCFDIKEKSEIDAFFQFVKELGGVDIFVRQCRRHQSLPFSRKYGGRLGKYTSHQLYGGCLLCPRGSGPFDA